MMWRVIRYGGGVILIPVAAAALLTLFQVAGDSLKDPEANMKLFLAVGAGGYIVLFVLLYRFIGEGMFARGPVQFLWKFILGKKPEEEAEEVRGLAGFISLLPYAFPVYTFVGAAIVVVINHIKPFSWNAELLALVVGLTYMHHVFFVARDLQKHHVSLASGGLLFSMMAVIILNIEVIAALFAVLFGRPSFFIAFNGAFIKKTFDWFTFFMRKAEQV